MTAPDAEGASGLREAVEALAEKWETINVEWQCGHAAQLRALLAAHPPEPEASAEEWGTNYNYRAQPNRAAAEALRAKFGGHLVRRTRTTYADRVTEWEEVDD